MKLYVGNLSYDVSDAELQGLDFAGDRSMPVDDRSEDVAGSVDRADLIAVRHAAADGAIDFEGAIGGRVDREVIVGDATAYFGDREYFKKQRDAKTKSRDEYARQVRHRGRDCSGSSTAKPWRSASSDHPLPRS